MIGLNRRSAGSLFADRAISVVVSGMIFLGLKGARYRQWRQVLLAEGKSFLRALPLALWNVFMSIFIWDHRRDRWRRRMRRCYRCPVFNRALRQCRPQVPPGADPEPFRKIGCGCFTPALAYFAPPSYKCWADANAPHLNVGWCARSDDLGGA